MLGRLIDKLIRYQVALNLEDSIRNRLARAFCLATLGNLEEAQADVDWVLGRDHANPSALKARGVLLARQGNFVEACLDFTKAIPLLQAASMPTIESVFNRAYARKVMHLTDEALADFELCLKLAPTNITSKVCLGYCLFLKRRWKEAMQLFDQQLIARPQSSAAVLNVALCQYNLAQSQLDKAQQNRKVVHRQNRAESKLRAMSSRKMSFRTQSSYKSEEGEEEEVDLSDDDEEEETDKAIVRKPLDDPNAWAYNYLESAGGTQSVSELKSSVDAEVIQSVTNLLEKSLAGLTLSLALFEKDSLQAKHATTQVSSSPRGLLRDRHISNSSVLDGVLTSHVFLREPGEGVEGMVLVLNNTQRVAGQPAVCDAEITDGEILYSRGLNNLCLGRLGDAEADFAHALASNPQGAHYPHYRAIVHARKGIRDLKELKSAVSWNAKALQMNEAYLPALIHLGICLHLLGRNAEAIHRLDSALALNKSGWFIIEARGRVLAALDRHREALAAFEAALLALDPEESDDTRSRLFMCIARSSIATHQPELLRHALKQARIHGQDSASIFNLRGLLAQKEKLLAKANLYMSRAVTRAPRESRFLFDRSRVHAERGDHKAAIKDMSQALEVAPSHSLNYYRGLSYLALGDEVKALNDFELAASGSSDLDRSSTVARLDASDYMPAEALSFTLKSNSFISPAFISPKGPSVTRLIMDSVLWEGSKVIGGSPDPPDLTAPLYYHLGILRARAGRTQEAREALEVACSLLPSQPAYVHELAKCRQACGDYTGAIEAFDKAIAIQPRNARAFFRRGLAHRSLGKYEEAAKDIELAKKVDPKEPAFHVNYKNLAGVHVIEITMPGRDEDQV